MFFCRKLPSTQKVATLTAIENDNFHPLQKNQRVKYPGSRTVGFKCELQFTTHYSSKPRTSTAQKTTLHLSAAQGPDGGLFLPSVSCNQTSRHLLPWATRPHCVSTTSKLNKQLWDAADRHHPSARYQTLRQLLTPPLQLETTLLWHSSNTATKSLIISTTSQLCHQAEIGRPEWTTETQDLSCSLGQPSEPSETPNHLWGSSHKFVLNPCFGQKAQFPKCPSSLLRQHSVSFHDMQLLF